MKTEQQLQAELSQKGSELATWKSLIEHPGWAWYKKVMEQQRLSRLFLVSETPLKTFGEALGQEFMKGEGAGIGLSLTLPYTQVELLQLDVNRLSTSIELEKSNVPETTDTASVGGSRVDDSRVFSND